MLPPLAGVWGMPPDVLRTVVGYDPECPEKNRAEARSIMEKLGYGPDKRLNIKIATRNIAVYRDPGGLILIDQLKAIYIDGELDTIETAELVFQSRTARTTTSGLILTGSGVDDPDQQFYENYACGSERNYTWLLQSRAAEAV